METPDTDSEDDAGREQRFARERREATRGSLIAGGVVAIIGMPLWSLFDYLLVPDDAWEFTLLRLAATALIVLSWLLLFTELGERRPEWLGLGILAPVQVAIALMVVQLDDRHAAYALGMSLAIYASGFLLAWRVRFTLGLVAISVLALAVGWLLAPDPVAAAEIATVGFYLLTAAAIAVAGQIVRDRAGRRQFETRCELEAEQLRTRELVQRLDRLSHTDSLTGVANRRAWDEAIRREFALLARADGGRSMAVLLCDVDRLKEINDTLGHGVGDATLRGVAELLRGRIRASDLVARIGGDEFAVMAVGSDEIRAAKLAEDLRALVERGQPGGPAAGTVTISVGVADWTEADGSPEVLMARVDRLLYTAKAERNVVCATEPAESAGA